MMWTFRRKIYLSYFLILTLFLILIFPLSKGFVDKILHDAMLDRTERLIEEIKKAPNEQAMIRKLQKKQPFLFSRILVFNSQMQIIYDSHQKWTEKAKIKSNVIPQKEILQALKEGIGYNEEYSKTFQQEFAYLAKTFLFKGKRYILRSAIPFKYVNDIRTDFALGFFVLVVSTLFLFSLITFLLIDKISYPIQAIIRSISPFQEGKSDKLPYIKFEDQHYPEDFIKLAKTLNKLSNKIKKQINSIEKEKQEKTTILESLVEGIVAIDHDLTIDYINKAALKFFQKKYEDLIRKNIDSLQNNTCKSLIISALNEHKIKQSSTKIKSEERDLFFNLIAIPIPEEKKAILVIEDKTKDHRINEMRKDFVANASHELKTPLTIIQGYAEMLHDHPHLPKEKVEEITNTIIQTVSHMTRLIKDLLTIADIEKLPQARLVKTNVLDIIHSCKKRLLQSFPTAHIKIIYNKNEKYEIRADARLLEQAIYNLLNNAAKYSTPPCDITVSLEKKDNQMIIKISDKGIGIPKSELENIFQRFYTVNKHLAKEKGSTGLGLSIVKTIIEKHYGKIDVQSTLGKGSTFTLSLPIKIKG